MEPITLYRNLSKEKYLNFKDRGEFRISPPSYYASIENETKRDRLEGLHGFQLNPENSVIRITPEQLPYSNINIPVDITAYPGSVINFQLQLPQAYVFCVSAKILMEHGEYNYQIVDPQSFGWAIFRILKEKGEKVIHWQLAKVQYGGHKDIITNTEDGTQLAISCNTYMTDIFISLLNIKKRMSGDMFFSLKMIL